MPGPRTGNSNKFKIRKPTLTQIYKKPDKVSYTTEKLTQINKDVKLIQEYVVKLLQSYHKDTRQNVANEYEFLNNTLAEIYQDYLKQVSQENDIN